MSDADIEHIRSGIDDLKTALAVHDSKSAMYVERIVAAQEQVAEAVLKVADSTDEMRHLVVEMRKSNGRPQGIMLDKKTLLWLLGLALGGSAALGGGQEVAHRMFHTMLGPPTGHETQGETHP